MGAEALTRVFLEQKCRFTLPGADWKWIDLRCHRGIHGLNLVRAENNLGYFIFLDEITAPQAGQIDLDFQEFAKVFEKNLSDWSEITKRDGRFVTYRIEKHTGRSVTYLDVPAYQTESMLPDGRTTATRVFIANGFEYTMGILGVKEPIENDPIFETLLKGLEFTAPPDAEAIDPPQPAADIQSFQSSCRIRGPSIRHNSQG